MGTLSNLGASLSQAFAPAGTSAPATLGWGAAATGLAASSQILSGIADMQQANYASKVAGTNAGKARIEGQIAESALKGKYTQLGAEQKVAQAANGIEVESGSAQRVRQATADIGAMDAALLHYKAASEAFGYETEAALYKKAGKAALGKGVAGAGLSILGGASSLADKWATYKNLGAV